MTSLRNLIVTGLTAVSPNFANNTQLPSAGALYAVLAIRHAPKSTGCNVRLGINVNVNRHGKLSLTQFLVQLWPSSDQSA